MTAESGGNGWIRHDVAGILSVLVIPGAGKASWEGNGDAVLVDDPRCVFAVADGPERNPGAAAAFLKRFRDGMHRLPDPPGPSRPVEDVFADLVAATNALIRETAYHDGTTFSAVVCGQGRGFAILHAGDSLIFLLRPGEGKALQLSRTNHCLVGRSPGLFQAEKARFGKDDLLLVASDGLAALARSFGLGTAAFLEGLMAKGASPREMMENLCRSVRQANGGLDDIGIVVVRPDRLPLEGSGIPVPSLLPGEPGGPGGEGP